MESKHLPQIGSKFGQEFKKIGDASHGRYVMVVDRRDDDDSKSRKVSDDEIYIYSPTITDRMYHQIEEDFVTEGLIHKTLRCLIPGLNMEIYDPHIGAWESDIITLSFHMLSKKLLRCYLWINGGVTRFEVNDLSTILPRHFKVIDISEPSLLDKNWIHNYFRLALQDQEFDNWYEQTTMVTNMSFV